MKVRFLFRLSELSTADAMLDTLIRLSPYITVYKIKHKPPFFCLYLSTKKAMTPHRHRKNA